MTNQTNDVDALLIEPFDGSDASYEAVARFETVAYPEYPATAEELQRGDAKRNPDHYRQRYVGRDASGQIVAIGLAQHNSGAFHPQRFWINVIVAPEQQGLGFGRTLHNHILDSLAPFNPLSVEGGTRSDSPRSLRFLEERGYTLKTREYSSMLDLNQFEPAQFASYVDRCAAAGVELLDHNEMRARFPDTWQRKLYDSSCTIHRDVPWHDTLTDPPFDQWIDRHLTHDDRINQSYVVAVDGDDIVGVTMLFRSKATPDLLFTGLTGVMGSHRRKGVAVALKCRSLGWAKANLKNSVGAAPSVMTENEENNPMYTINERMGFVRKPDFLMYRKELTKT